MITALVILRCSACRSSAQVTTPGELCPGSSFHVHISTDDPQLKMWFSSHHQPRAEILAVAKRRDGGGSAQDR